MTAHPDGRDPEWTAAVRGVAERAGLDPLRIAVEPLPAGTPSTADYRAADGRVTIRATDPVAAAVALARYVRDGLGVRLTWRRPRVTTAGTQDTAALPDVPRTVVSSPHELRYYLNVVTYGYSAPFWGWDRWEREIDWMALHGVTHPLMLVGHEAVLGETFRRAGLPAADVADWIGGAGHLPWTFMGGMHSFGGPLPARWAERRVELARRVLRRMRELGLTAVLPAFGGHVPPALAPPGAAGETEWQGWRTPLLHPETAAYRELGATFAQVQRELLGAGTGWYAVDPYIESVPPSGDLEYLRSAGRGTYRAMADGARAAGEPDPVWVLQGWPFHYQGTFWTPDRVGAYLDDVPADRSLVLDLWGEYAPLHTALLAEGAPLAGRPWAWCAVHNFGGRPALFGDLPGLVEDVRALPDGVPNLRGIGLAPEAIENNEVFYELATDLAWDDAPRSPADLDAWLDRFVLDRYALPRPGPGGAPIAEPARLALRAWHTIYSTLYDSGRTRSIPTPVIARPWTADLPFPAQRSAGEAVAPQADGGAPRPPSSNIDAENDPTIAAALPRLAQAARDLRAVADTVSGPAHAVLMADLADVEGHVLAQGTRVHVRGILAAARAGDPAGVVAHMGRLRDDLLALDDLAGQRPETRLATWVAAACSWGETPAERATLEREARSLVSVWGDQHNGLHDYSGRHWQGLVSGLYLPRWQTWADWLADAAERGPVPPDADPTTLQRAIVAHEESWRAGAGAGEGSPDDRQSVR